MLLISDIGERRSTTLREPEFQALLAQQREMAREEERRRIAREIHDELGQHLTSLRISLSLMRVRCGEDNPSLLAQLQQLMTLADNSLQAVRDAATRLRPGALNLGLMPALEWLRDHFVRQYGCPCRLLTPEEEPALADEYAVAVFRVAQESLTNVARHAGASQVTIALEKRDGRVALSVRDDGRGFDIAACRPQTCGLIGMQERGRMLGGEVVVESAPGAGTLVRLTFPQP